MISGYQKPEEKIEKRKNNTQLFVGILAALAVIIAALIEHDALIDSAIIPIRYTQTAEIQQTLKAVSLSTTEISGVPAHKFTNPAPTLMVAATAAPISVSPMAQKIETQVTGDSQKEYSVDLLNGEILVGHGTTFTNFSQNYNEVAFLIIGSGHFDFELKTGLWDKWINVKPEAYDGLIKEQADTLIRYGKSPIVVICNSSSCQPKTSVTSTPQPFMQNQENFPASPASPISTPHVILKDGELLIGTAVRFAARAFGCNTIDTKGNFPLTAFLIRGPIELDVEIDNGGWDYWVNVYDENFAKSLFVPKKNEVMAKGKYIECVIPPFK